MQTTILKCKTFAEIEQLANHPHWIIAFPVHNLLFLISKNQIPEVSNLNKKELKELKEYAHVKKLFEIKNLVDEVIKKTQATTYC